MYWVSKSREGDPGVGVDKCRSDLGKGCKTFLLNETVKKSTPNRSPEPTQAKILKPTRRRIFGGKDEVGFHTINSGI